MKNYIKIIIVILSLTRLYPQECIVLFPPGVSSIPDRSYGDPTILESFTPTFVRTLYVSAHIVRTSAGSGGDFNYQS